MHSNEKIFIVSCIIITFLIVLWHPPTSAPLNLQTLQQIIYRSSRMALGSVERPLKKCPSVVVVIIIIVIIIIYLKTNASRNKNNLIIFGHLICQTGSGWQEELKRLFQRISLVTFLELGHVMKFSQDTSLLISVRLNKTN